MSNYNPWFQLSEQMQVDLQVGSCWNDLLPMPMCHEFGFIYIYIQCSEITALSSMPRWIQPMICFYWSPTWSSVPTDSSVQSGSMVSGCGEARALKPALLAMKWMFHGWYMSCSCMKYSVYQYLKGYHTLDSYIYLHVRIYPGPSKVKKKMYVWDFRTCGLFCTVHQRIDVNPGPSEMQKMLKDFWLFCTVHYKTEILGPSKGFWKCCLWFVHLIFDMLCVG